jgi:hypothetical protein
MTSAELAERIVSAILKDAVEKVTEMIDAEWKERIAVYTTGQSFRRTLVGTDDGGLREETDAEFRERILKIGTSIAQAAVEGDQLNEPRR